MITARRRAARTSRRLVWQASALLLAYPDEGQPERLDTVEAMLGHLPRGPRDLLAATVAHLRRTGALEAATGYVETFDLRRRSTLYLTYWTDGDTRNRGAAILAFADAYRSVGAAPPTDESPDHLAVLLEFAATVDAELGASLLAAHRVPIGMVHRSLAESGSPYASVLAAVAATLPAETDQDVARARRLAHTGPPAESVGLQPFTLTVPPRRERREGVR